MTLIFLYTPTINLRSLLMEDRKLVRYFSDDSSIFRVWESNDKYFFERFDESSRSFTPTAYGMYILKEGFPISESELPEEVEATIG